MTLPLTRFPFRFWIRAMKCRFRDHRQEMAALLRGVGRGEVAIDVGANKGAFVWSLARRVGRTGRLILIEPQPVLADVLRTTAAAFGWSQVEVHAMAASDRVGRLPLHVPPAGTSPGATLVDGSHVPKDWTTVEVPIAPLDTMLEGERRRVGAIKIDVEGFEPEVLRGAEGTILAHRPVIVFECEERHLERSNAMGSVREVIAWLVERGYAVSLVSEGRLVSAEEYAPQRHQRREGERFWDAPGYCNNFVAVPRR
jgi:FkbM family methyltransferase